MTRLNVLANEFLTRPAVPRCCLCGCEILPGQFTSNGVHADCERDEWRGIDADVRTLLYAGMSADADHAEWVRDMERDFGHLPNGPEAEF